MNRLTANLLVIALAILMLFTPDWRPFGGATLKTHLAFIAFFVYFGWGWGRDYIVGFKRWYEKL